MPTIKNFSCPGAMGKGPLYPLPIYKKAKGKILKSTRLQCRGSYRRITDIYHISLRTRRSLVIMSPNNIPPLVTWPPKLGHRYDFHILLHEPLVIQNLFRLLIDIGAYSLLFPLCGVSLLPF